MPSNKKSILRFLKWLISRPFSWTLIVVLFFIIYGIHYSTGNGEHLGYISASETTGIIFKTKRIYFKTSLRSSQEDKYCVIDKDVYKRLQKVKPNQQIDIYYESYLANGIKNCSDELAIITGFGLIIERNNNV